MTPRILGALLAGGFALTGTAAIADMSALDTDGDGLVSFEEMIAAVPTVSEETFTTIDTNADGTLDAEEFAAAEAAGTLPPTDG
ncbi:EF-hand domain-containing protein [Ovoidimarina sediminis]|uniref:EF-hand domain-containing protein n=1 Tax=Ovoidimarina sediminis TaxID=3079856 RepID=UPI002911E4D2|nr:EF-hand domain-containing protein [Rhodophyticola sp. MJ-SS7]MDU8942247.1 EF-hand domain-containing protein [Rhodophyticola sp. MJ-SS7]